MGILFTSSETIGFSRRTVFRADGYALCVL